MTPPATAASPATAPAAHHALRRLSLTDFRSHAATVLELESSPALIALTGGNGAGKTGILEAVSLLAPGRGMHGIPFRDLARRDGPGGWAVAAELEGAAPDSPSAVSTALPPDSDADGRSGKSGRIARIDKKTVSPGALARLLRMVWLTPAMDRLFGEAASGRRRFLDRMVLAFQPDHAAAALAYERAMRARNRLLETGTSGQWLDTLEDAMARHGLRMARYRADVAARLDAALREAPCEAFPPARLAISGFTADSADDSDDSGAQERFRETLRGGRERDARAGRTLEGAHLCDLDVVHVGERGDAMPARACSAGEQKALLLSILLAHARLMRDGGTPPLLLLDDVTAHLDDSRRTALFKTLSRLAVQVWMSGTDRQWFKGHAMQLFHVARDGDQTRVSPA